MLEFNAEKHEYKWDGRIVPSVSNFLAPYMDFSKIPEQILKDKIAFGNSVHDYTKQYDLGLLDMDNLPIDETGKTDIRAIMNGWIEFQKTLDKTKFTVLEIKTSEPRRATGVQLALYTHLAKESGIMEWIEQPPGLYSPTLCFAGTPDRFYSSIGGSVPTLISWHVNELGKWHIKEYNYRECWNQAQCLMSNYNYFKGE